jgi:RNA polymerase sigma factor (sigma-70 family)
MHARNEIKYLSGNPGWSRIDWRKVLSGSVTSQIGDIMHEVVLNDAMWEKARSVVGIPSPMPVASTPCCSNASPENEQLKQIHEKLVALHEALRPKLLRMVRARISPRLQRRIDAEGVLQSALLRLIKCMNSKMPLSDLQLRSWLYKKVWSQLQDEIRKYSTLGRDVERELGLPDESIADLACRLGVSTHLGLKDAVELIRQALTPTDFEIVCLNIQDELSYGEIAEIFDTTAEAVRKRCVRALLKIREHPRPLCVLHISARLIGQEPRAGSSVHVS